MIWQIEWALDARSLSHCSINFIVLFLCEVLTRKKIYKKQRILGFFDPTKLVWGAYMLFLCLVDTSFQ